MKEHHSLEKYWDFQHGASIISTVNPINFTVCAAIYCQLQSTDASNWKKFNQLTVMCKHIKIISINHLSVSGDKAKAVLWVDTRRWNVTVVQRIQPTVR